MRPWLHPLESPAGPLGAGRRGRAGPWSTWASGGRSTGPGCPEVPGAGHRPGHGTRACWSRCGASWRPTSGASCGTFDLPLAPRGTPFQLKVWAELLNIPYGRTISYGELSRRLGDPNLSRAVGAANGANPISIIVPCHRVIGASGSLVGYGGGLDIKRILLDLEAPAPDAERCSRGECIPLG